MVGRLYQSGTEETLGAWGWDHLGTWYFEICLLLHLRCSDSVGLWANISPWRINWCEQTYGLCRCGQAPLFCYYLPETIVTTKYHYHIDLCVMVVPSLSTFGIMVSIGVMVLVVDQLNWPLCSKPADYCGGCNGIWILLLLPANPSWFYSINKFSADLWACMILSYDKLEFLSD